MKTATVTFLFIVLVCLFSLGCNPIETSESANLKPEVSIDNVYYEINGVSENDLRHQMNQLGPSDERRIQHDAYTEWYVDWYYAYSETNGNCAAGPVTVTVTITHTFPKWNNPPNASAELIEKWNSYLKALQIHEAGHRQMGLEAGQEILQVLNDLSVYPTCAELEQIADRLGQDILDEFRQQEITYDQTTRHGATQGARFP